MKNIGVILAGGTGERVGGIPKQYMHINGREVISYSVEAFRASANTNSFFIVADKMEAEKRSLSARYGVPCATSGSTRNESIFNALVYIKEQFADCENVLIHESPRPFVTAEIIDAYFEYLNEYDAVITAQHISDSLGQNGRHVTDRDDYYLIQAPEAFKFKLMLRHFSKDSPLTATVQQLPFDIKMKKHFEFRTNFKITYREDINIAEQMLKSITNNESGK